ncbi:MAG TPA: hypothetical protein VLI41_11610 [Phenylobacterium sp.]|uniref:hypothetical protein n=1 Tax=Phenylobacterium sp. TaxID=1871053 RepID=UPI002B614A6B|nr:hypothetical protein [Phenylobacterium sp.]HSV03838.1 hypothetical protein [Phenylobacterium sp.]
MARDLGDRRAPSRRKGRALALIARLGMAVGVGGPILTLAVIPTLIGVAAGAPDPDNPKRGATGAPCRPVSQAEFERGWKDPPRTFVFQGAAFSRRRGDADCTVLHAGPLGPPYPACRFTTPAAVGVRAAGKAAYFDIGPGLTAEVEARPSGVRCVVTGRHRLYAG